MEEGLESAVCDCDHDNRFGLTAICLTPANSLLDMKLDTKWPADSVEFCPHPKATNILVCGTYFLCDTKSDVVPNVVEGAEEPEVTPSPQRRRGQCIVLNVSDVSTQPRAYGLNDLSKKR